MKYMNENIINGGFDSIYSVMDFGAIGDGKYDNTDAFNNALKTAGDNGGGIVFVPSEKTFKIRCLIGLSRLI